MRSTHCQSSIIINPGLSMQLRSSCQRNPSDLGRIVTHIQNCICRLGISNAALIKENSSSLRVFALEECGGPVTLLFRDSRTHEEKIIIMATDEIRCLFCPMYALNIKSGFSETGSVGREQAACDGEE